MGYKQQSMNVGHMQQVMLNLVPYNHAPPKA